MAHSRPFKEDRRALPLSTPLIKAIDGVMSLALRPLVVSETPRHFRSAETQATYGAWLCPPVYLLGHFLSRWSAQGSGLHLHEIQTHRIFKRTLIYSKERFFVITYLHEFSKMEVQY